MEKKNSKKVRNSEKKPGNRAPTPSPRIFFEDAHLVVLSKPAGLLSQGEQTGDANLVDWCRGHFGRNYVGLVHRLDRNTSGLMVVAKRTKSADRLTRALREGTLVRVYRALLSGRLEAPAEWRHSIRKDERTNLSRAVRSGTPGAKESILHVSPIECRTLGETSVTLAEFRLETGRSHQIRVQSAAEGHSLLGDSKYGSGSFFVGSLTLAHPALHSFRIEFPHPMSGEALRFEDPLPENLAAIWNAR